MKQNRIRIRMLIQLLIILFFLSSCLENNIEDATSDSIMWYNSPATNWFEALPLGNGKLGAMVHGTLEKEKLQLNEESLWAGCPEDPVPENAKIHYAKFQELNLNGEYSNALEYANKNLAVSPTSIRSYQPLGELYISFNKHNNAQEYRRSLDLQTGISTVEYKINGKRFIRESFISTKYNAIFHHFKSLDNEVITSEISFEREKDITQQIKNNILVIDGQIFDDPKGYDDNEGGSGKGGYHMKFAANVLIKNNSGQVKSSGNKLMIENSVEYTVIATAATDYNVNSMNYDRSISPLIVCKQAIKKALEVDYKKIKEEHIAYHSDIFNRVQFDITPNNIDTIPTDKRITDLKNTTEDKHLTELFFQFGRYMLMSSSGGNSLLPANLQGIWNNDMWARWESDFHLNINLQMNYWPAENCNLSETMRPLSHFMKNLSKKGEVTASKYIDTEGWVAHHVSNAFGRTTPSGSNISSQIDNGYSFPMAGAWMSITLWRHYEFTQDKLYLENTAYPILSGAAKFILDFLKENKKGELVTAPSFSPENYYIEPRTGEKLRNTTASSIDIQIIRDIFNACLQSEIILNKNTNLTQRITNALKRLPNIKVGNNGTIQEWYEDYEEVDIDHRHISHLYALYPSNQINRNTPLLFEAAKKTLERRLSKGGAKTGWGRAWMINFYARLFNGDECNKQISGLLAEQVSSNLFDLYPPHTFQIDGNLGATSGIAEMLLQSHIGEIHLLPALPSNWKDGEIKGLCARGGFEVDMKWESGKLIKAILYSKTGNNAMVRYNGKVLEIETKKDKSYLLEF
jgi:alpha-L-fucosidase 2